MEAAVASALPKGAAVSQGSEDDYLDITRLRRQLGDFDSIKQAEGREMLESRRYFHGDHWTKSQLRELARRRQAPTTENMVVKKINGVVGVVERLRQDVKAYPRTPLHDEGAELATASLRYVLDSNDWKSKSTRIAQGGAIDGIAGIEYDLVPGDHKDPSVECHIVYGDVFFYDPRSFDEGFTDARYLGVQKWVDLEQVKEIAPEKADELDELMESGSDLGTVADSEREKNWINSNEKKLRLVDHWYIYKGKWRWCLYVGNTILMQGVSPFIDEKGKTFPRYRMFSAAIDHDGDRYGFNRNLKPMQDIVNNFNSKKIHIINSRRVISEKGAVDDVERARTEWARPDGWVEVNPGLKVEPDTTAITDFKGLTELGAQAREYLENFGPNPSLIGQGLEDSSGRAIQLLQQAAIAELGPYLSAFKNWKIRVYRDLWNIIQRYWTEERWLRVTDDQNVSQFFQINKLQFDQYGNPSIVNQLGSLDVDIILDEGPDAVNMQADSMQVLQMLGPQFAQEFPDIALELSPLQNSVKKPMIDKIRQKQNQPPPPDPKVMALQAKAQLDQQGQQFDQQMQVRQQQIDEQAAAREQARQDEQARADMHLEQMRAAFDQGIERMKAASQIEIEKIKAAAGLQIQREKADQDRDIAEDRAAYQAQLAKSKAKEAA